MKQGMPSRRATRALLTCCVLLVLFCTSFAGAQQQASESQVKAAYLFNFGKFVKWPPAKEAPGFGICVLGKSPFADELQATVRGESIDGKPVAVRPITSPQQAMACHVVFISASEE